jgi:hypothetical protein
MKDELMILLGCGLTALLVTNACSSMYEADDDMEDGGRRRRKQERINRYDCEGYEGGCSSWDYKKKEGYGGCGSSNMDKKEEGYGGYSSSSYNLPSAPAPASVDYYSEPKSESDSIVPLMFSNMVTNNDIEEPFLESDYIEMKDYLQNPDGIKVYDEKTGQVGLPVTDMTQISAGENNKYVYDRTIGTIGFTSTKIGGRSRGQADFIRGDLPIIPDKSGWFQVSSDPANKLMLGAMNVANGIGQPSGPAKSAASKAQHMASTATANLDTLRRKQDAIERQANQPAGAQNALRAPLEPITVADIINASIVENKAISSSTGVSTSSPPSMG